MSVTVQENLEKDRLELKFTTAPSKKQSDYLKEIGFKESFSDTKAWYADRHPAYLAYAKKLASLANNEDWKQLSLAPSFDASNKSIDDNKFSLITFVLNATGVLKKESYVLFDSYKKVATQIATKFGESTYGSKVTEVKVFPRNYKKQARALFAEGKIIPIKTEVVKEVPKEEKQILEENTSLIKKESPSSSKEDLVIAKDLFRYGKQIRNVLVPNAAKEPFQSGNITIGDAQFLKFKFPELYQIEDDTLQEATSLQLFQLLQMAHPTDFGMQVHRGSLLQEWENRGQSIFKAIGFPTDMNYPYVNLHTGYKSVESLEKVLHKFYKDPRWWGVADNWRPVADIDKGLGLIEKKQEELITLQQEYFNPKTGKVKTSKEAKEKFNDIQWDVERFEASKQVLLTYQSITQNSSTSSKKEEITKETTNAEVIKDDYLDRVIAIMHEHYTKGERVTKKKIEKLKEKTGSPSLGALWEAVELSWLLWYKQLYKEPIPFESRLRKMIQFWEQVQPTYAYSDSSKELYKQYSTPCIIGAIISEYTGMSYADLIFEPSAGNGLLVMGAEPKKTHVNEIDKSRRKSLKYQGFQEVTMLNAAEPFIPSMTKAYDVVVTNPPFAKWEASEFEKMRLIHKYFGKHHILPRHLRLEHLMSAIALHSMKDNGRAALVLMGHVYFDNHGLIAKYRPFFNWLYRHYYVDDIINMNGFKLYNKQGAVTQTMLILIQGRKAIPEGISPHQPDAPHLDQVIENFQDLWEEVQLHIRPNVSTLITQLKTANTNDIL